MENLKEQLNSLSDTISRQWDDMAEKYGLGNVEAQKYILFPAVSSMILPTINQGDRVLDLGCGDGAYAQLFAERVGVRGLVKGIDISAEQIRKAFSLCNSDNVEFAVGDVGSEGKGVYNLVFSNMVICNIPKAGVDSYFEGISRTLVKGGVLALTNVDESCQKNFSSRYLVHDYPENFKNGDEIHVSLFLSDGGKIGPFKNFYYSAEYLEMMAEKHGLKLKAKDVLRSNKAGEENEGTAYVMLTFCK